jgi:hypothetical protein
MTYSAEGDKITIEMSRDDYDLLTIMLGSALGSAFGDKRLFYAWVDFANRLNAGNPRWAPYEIPAEFQPNHADRT